MKNIVLLIIGLMISATGFAQQPVLGLSFMPYQESVTNINCQKGLCGNTPLVFYQQIATAHYHFGKNTAAWWPADSSYNYFNEHQRDSLNVTYSYSRALGQWQNKRRLIYSYDNNGIETASTIQVWDSINNMWKNFDQVVYYHNADGLLSSYVFQNWDTTRSKWLNLQQTTETYNNKGNVVSNLTQNWDTIIKTWIDLSKIINHYNNRGKNDTSTELSWSDKWLKYERHIHDYDFAGNDTTVITQRWENTSMGEGWTNYHKNTYTYNESSSPLVHTHYVWDRNKMVFKPISKDQHTYDFYNNDTLYETFVADSVNRAWIAATKTNKLLDNNNNKSYELLAAYNATNDLYDATDQYYYYYNSMSGGNSFVQPDSIPGIIVSNNFNTASREMVLTVDLDREAPLVVSVYDMSGALLQTIQRIGSTGVNEFFLQMNNMNSGFYNIQVANTLTKAATTVKVMVP